MIYREFGKTGISLSALGLGTNRFLTRTESDILHSVKLVKIALDSGVNYIDIARTYSKGYSFPIIRKALEALPHKIKTPHITIKIGLGQAGTSKIALEQTKEMLADLGLKKATFFVIWSIQNYEQFLEITKPGGLYDGAVLAKESGLINHITASVHCPPSDILKIAESGLFEGITISYSAASSAASSVVIKRLGELKLGVITMNSLGGGLIPQNEKFFSFLKQDGDTLSQAALSWVYAHSEVTSALSGMKTIEELNENLKSFNDITFSLDKSTRYLESTKTAYSKLENFCTGCRYCEGCPRGINISELMQSHNMILLANDSSLYNRTRKRLLENINICNTLKNTFQFLPPDSLNPCIACGKCEKSCTQKIPIIQNLIDLYDRFSESAFSKKAISDRLYKLCKPEYKKIAFYPGGGYTTVVLDYLEIAIPHFPAEIFLFDSNPKLWGTSVKGIIIRNPAEVEKIMPQTIIISNYIYSDEIFNQIKHYEEQEILVQKLHLDNDVPWVF